MKLWDYVNWPALLFGLMIGFCIHSEWRLHNKLDDHIANFENLEKLADKKGLFFVVAYKPNGAVNHQILADSVRKNSDKHEVVCREWKTGEVYIFKYPCSVTDVTLAQDYIKFTTEK